jgi:hypothetical protein
MGRSRYVSCQVPTYTLRMIAKREDWRKEYGDASIAVAGANAAAPRHACK